MKRDPSRLRRLIIGLQVANGESKDAVSWLRSLPKSQENGEWIEKDQAWLSALTAQDAADNAPGLSPREVSAGLDAGIEAAKLSPQSEEALSGLRAATVLATLPSPSKRQNRELEASPRSLLNSEQKAEARAVLVRHFEFHRDTRSIQSLR